MAGTVVAPMTYSSKAHSVSPLDWNAWVALINTKVVSKTANYTATTAEGIILCNGTFTVTLPTAVGIQGKVFNIKNTGTGTITVDANGTQTIDGQLTQLLEDQYMSLQIVSDGANWNIL